jgi:hypothetical protein
MPCWRPADERHEPLGELPCLRGDVAPPGGERHGRACQEEADPEEEVEDENPFISAYDGEYDYQFIKF